MTRKPRLLSNFLISFLVAFTSVFAWGASQQVINIGNVGDPNTLDPHKAIGVYEFRVIGNIFEPLIYREPDGKKFFAGVAESWASSPDAKEWTFHLRKNAKWSNGEPLTAQDFVYSWRRILAPATAAEYATFLYVLKNGAAINKQAKKPEELGVVALDPLTLKVTLENPTPYFDEMLGFLAFLPVHKATVEKFGDRWTRPENIVSNGAFKISKWRTHEVLTMVRNPNYWDAAHVKLDEANFFPIDNLNTEEKMFRTKKLQVTYEVPPEKVNIWVKDKTNVFHSDLSFAAYFFRLNTKHKPLNDQRVRRALSLAIDRDRMVRFVARGNQEPAQSWVPPSLPGYKPPLVLPKDGSQIKTAQRLLAEAGFPQGQGFPALEILYNTQEINKKICEALQAMWKENLGIEVKLLNQEWKVYLNNLYQGNYDVARGGWSGDYQDPSTFLQMWTSGDGNNATGFANPKYDKLMADSAKLVDQKRRALVLEAAETLLLEEAPIIPLYVQRRNYLLSKEVQGWEANLLDRHPLRFVSIK